MTPKLSPSVCIQKASCGASGNFIHISWYKLIQMVSVDIHLSPFSYPIPSEIVLCLKKQYNTTKTNPESLISKMWLLKADDLWLGKKNY